jgi:transcriptional regulator of the spore photoproduct lyase operon
MIHLYQPGDIVYVICRNPHAQDVASVQQAAVVRHPDNPGQQGLFLHETFYPLSDDLAVFASASEAMQAYEDSFGSSGEEPEENTSPPDGGRLP